MLLDIPYILINRVEIPIDLGDQFIDNGSCIQFAPKHNADRKLRSKRDSPWERLTSKVIPNKQWKRVKVYIAMEELIVVEKDLGWGKSYEVIDVCPG